MKKADQRELHFTFIENDTEKRGEEIISGKYFASLYFFDVKDIATGKKRKVTYSAAETVAEGYRAIILTTPQTVKP